MFISNPKVSLEQITSKFTKLNLPNSTETIGIRHINKSLDLLIDINTFTSEVNFNIYEKISMSDEDRDRFIDLGDSVCDTCNFYSNNNEIEIEDNEDYKIAIQMIDKLTELNLFLLRVKELTLQEGMNKALEKSLYDVFNYLRQVLYSFPNLKLKNIKLLISKIKRYRETLYFAKEMIQAAIIEILSMGTDKQLHISYKDITYFMDPYNIFVNNRDRLNGFSNDVYVTTNISVEFTDCIIKFVELFNKNHRLLDDALNELFIFFDDYKICGGVRLIGEISDCLSYTEEYMHTDLYFAYQLLNETDKADEYSEITDTIELKIPAHFYRFDLNRDNIYAYADISINPYNKSELIFYPLYFPNIYADGEICFNDNVHEVVSLIYSGKFSHALEIFWGSDFNHDLSDIGFQDLIGSTYTQAYQENLSKRLQEVFNIDDKKSIDKGYVSDYSETTYLADDWEWLSVSKYDFYIKSKGNPSTLLIIDKETETIHKVITY